MMRTIILIAAILLSYAASAQTIGQLRYDTVKILKVGGNGELKVQNSTRDSIGGIFTNVGGGWGQWLKPRQVGDTLFIGLDSFIVVGGSGGGLSSVYAENGLTAVNDSTLRLGGAVDSGAVLQVVNVERMNNRNSRIFITNDTTGLDDDYDDTFTQNGLSGSLLRITKKSTEARGDTLNLQYGGAMSMLYDRFYDSTSSRFVAGGTDIGLNNLGYYSQARFYPPRDSVNVYTSTFGVTGSLFAGALGFGNSYGYNLYVAPSNPTSNPDLPISVSKMEIDFVREIDQTRRKKMTGTGVTSYFSDWKLLQSTINGSTPTIGNYISKVRGFHAYGGVYTQVGGALTKEQDFSGSPAPPCR